MKNKKEINYCNDKGDVCIASFRFKEDNQIYAFEEFLSKLYDEKFWGFDSNDEFEVNSLILYFKNFDFDEIAAIYDGCKKRDDDNICNIILDYLNNFYDFDCEIFCTSDECGAIRKISNKIIFRNHESIVLKKVENSKRVAIIDDFIKYRENLFWCVN